MTWQLRGCTILAQDPRVVPGTHVDVEWLTTSYKSSFIEFNNHLYVAPSPNTLKNNKSLKGDKWYKEDKIR